MQLAAVWREATALGGPPLSDAELLRRQQTDPGDASFAALVQRYGRLVWLVCRQLTRCDADADDAFQAVFVVLLRNVGSIRQAGKLPAWLHGVAIKVCAKQRLSQQRRLKRESRHALPDAASPVVPPTKWDATLLAVQEEVANLPETLRVPFVLACLEGQSSGDAARALGWKLGTFTGRLSKAKDVLLARLEARGVIFSVAGLVAGVGLMVAPGSVLAKACLLNVVVPSSILPLTYGVVAMTMKPLKILALTIGLAGGLGVIGWSQMPGPSANAQQGKAEAKPEPSVDPVTSALLDRELESLRARVRVAEQEAARNREQLAVLESAKKKFAETIETRNFETSTPELAFEKLKAYAPEEFAKYLKQQEAAGWQFIGQVTLKNVDSDTNYWAFRKTAAKPATLYTTMEKGVPAYRPVESTPLVYRSVEMPAPSKESNKTRDEVELLRSQVESLKEQLAKVTKEPEAKDDVKYELLLTKTNREELLSVSQYLSVVSKSRFDGKLHYKCGTATPEGFYFELSGSKEACDWAKSILQPTPAEKPKK